MKWGVVVFPGSNDDRDTLYALQQVLGFEACRLWHGQEDLCSCDAIVLPGGFSYGDYLRCGALARFAPVMRAVARFANTGGPVLGICNGFQILCEAKLLPGALVRNSGRCFLCRPEIIQVKNATTAFSAKCKTEQTLTMPIKHGEGCFVADEATLACIERNRQVVFRYAGGAPNGSAHDIAGVCNEAGNVVGLMPHPEHAVDELLDGTDGRRVFESVLSWRTGR